MRGDSGANDFEDLLKDSELDSAKMILRLTSELKEKEQEIGRLLVEKESALWQKYQKMLDDSVSAHRGELEEERARPPAGKLRGQRSGNNQALSGSAEMHGKRLPGQA
jgi:hypothetical protein